MVNIALYKKFIKEKNSWFKLTKLVIGKISLRIMTTEVLGKYFYL